MIGFSTDLATLTYYAIMGKLKTPKLTNRGIQDRSASVIIPAYNEGKAIVKTVKSMKNQTHNVESIFIGDDCSTDNTGKIGQKLAEYFDNVNYYRNEKNSGKASTINNIIEKHYDDLGQYVLVMDGDTEAPKNTIEELLKNFYEENIAAVTASGGLTPNGNFIDREIHYGKDWAFSVFGFRKKAQSLRNAIVVINGSCTMYDKEILKQYPLQPRTQTEDTDHTWELLEEGYKIIFEDSVADYAEDIKGVKKNYTQTFRWFSGTWQNLYVHGKDLKKSPSLLYSTIIPSLMDGVPYSIAFAALPVIGALSLPGIDVIDPNYFLAGVVTDFLLTTIPTALIKPKSLLHLPGIYAYKYISALSFIHSGIKTFKEKIFGQEERWNNRWRREQNE